MLRLAPVGTLNFLKISAASFSTAVYSTLSADSAGQHTQRTQSTHTRVQLQRSSKQQAAAAGSTQQTAALTMARLLDALDEPLDEPRLVVTVANGRIPGAALCLLRGVEVPALVVWRAFSTAAAAHHLGYVRAANGGQAFRTGSWRRRAAAHRRAVAVVDAVRAAVVAVVVAAVDADVAPSVGAERQHDGELERRDDQVGGGHLRVLAGALILRRDRRLALYRGGLGAQVEVHCEGAKQLQSEVAKEAKRRACGGRGCELTVAVNVARVHVDWSCSVRGGVDVVDRDVGGGARGRHREQRGQHSGSHRQHGGSGSGSYQQREARSSCSFAPLLRRPR